MGGGRGWQWGIDCLWDFAADTLSNTLASDSRVYGLRQYLLLERPQKHANFVPGLCSEIHAKIQVS